MGKMLNENHWRVEDFAERMTTAEWKDILLSENDTIIFHGRVRRIVAKKLGAGVVEVKKGGFISDESGE